MDDYRFVSTLRASHFLVSTPGPAGMMMGAREFRWRARAVRIMSGCLLVLLCQVCLPPLTAAEDVRIAVASNFAATLREIVAGFERDTGHAAVVSSGSSGTLYAQIKHGAPFDVFFSADVARPKVLEEEDLAVRGSRITYAVGRLTLWSADPEVVKDDGRSALSGNVEYLAMANPRTAPYGVAAKQTLQAMGLWNPMQGRIVQGENIGQTFQFIFSQNVRLGFVALSQVLDPSINGAGSRWDVPTNLYDPLHQQAVLLVGGQTNKAAHALLEYVQGEKAGTIMARFGYGLE